MTETRGGRPTGSEHYRCELGSYVRRAESALPPRIVVVVADAELAEEGRRKDLGPSADDRGRIELCVQRGQVRERVAGHLEGDAVRIAILIARAEEKRVVLPGFIIESQVAALPLAGLRHELLKDAVAAGHGRSLVWQRVEHVQDGPRRRIDAA